MKELRWIYTRGELYKVSINRLFGNYLNLIVLELHVSDLRIVSQSISDPCPWGSSRSILILNCCISWQIVIESSKSIKNHVESIHERFWSYLILNQTLMWIRYAMLTVASKFIHLECGNLICDQEHLSKFGWSAHLNETFLLDESWWSPRWIPDFPTPVPSPAKVICILWLTMTH